MMPTSRTAGVIVRPLTRMGDRLRQDRAVYVGGGAHDGLIQTLDPGPAAIATLRDVFVGRLVRSDEEGVIVRRRALRDELPAEALPLLQSFVDSRLLVAGRDAAGRAMPSGTYVVRLGTRSGVEARKVMLIR